jgi:hypothetical protein
VSVVGDLVYVADFDGAMRVVNAADPATPLELGSIDTSGRPQGVSVVDGLAYVATLSGGVVVIDVSDPAEPIEVTVIDTPGPAQD